MSERIYFTRFTSDNCQLTKKHSLTPQGKLHTVPSAHMSNGKAETLFVPLSDLPSIITGLKQNQCLGLGAWIEGLLEEKMECEIVTAGQVEEGKIARTLKHFQFLEGHPALMYIDVDGTSLSMDDAHDLLCSIDPALCECGIVATYSSSSHIYKADGSTVRGGGSMHFFFVISDGSRMKEYGQLLFNRLILAGHGKTLVDKSGKVWVKTLIDNSVWSPEREVFEAVPVCEDGLVSKKNDFIVFQDGPVLDIDASIATLQMNKTDELKLRLTTSELKKSVEEDAKGVQEYHRLQLAKARAEKNQTSVKEELRVLYSRSATVDKDNRPVITIPASDWIMMENGTEIQVSDILTDPDGWHGKTLPDIDEPYYGGDPLSKTPGKQKAKIFVNYAPDGGREIIVNSNAHGGILYKLVWDFKQLLSFMKESSNDELEELWQDFEHGHMADLVLSAGELDDIGKIFKDKLGSVAGAGVSSTKSDVIRDLKRNTKSKGEQHADTVRLSVEEELWRLNKKYAVTGLGHTCRIFTEVFKPEVHKYELVAKDKTALSQIYANKLVPVQKGNTVSEISLFDLWMEWPHRNTFHYSDLRPTATRFRGCGKPSILQQQEVEYDTFNTWQGYLCNFDRATSCEKIKSHILDVWCSGEVSAYDYVTKWLAHLFQKPAERCQTALVFRSAQGAGKNVIIDKVLGRLLGVHYVMASKSALITGRFNSMIAQATLVYLNEALWSGDKAAAGVVKSQTTDDEITIERKGIEPEGVRNYARYIYGSNGDWVTGVEYGDRRYFYAPVSDHRKGDEKYFGELMAEIENGGRESFLDYLMKIDIATFNTALMPEVGGQQKFIDMMQTESPALGFMFSMFRDPRDLLATVANLESWIEKPLLVTREALWEGFKFYCEDSKIKRGFLPQHAFFRALSTYFMVSDTESWDACIARTRRISKYNSCIEFPKLSVCREKFGKIVGCEVEW